MTPDANRLKQGCPRERWPDFSRFQCRMCTCRLRTTAGFAQAVADIERKIKERRHD